MAAKKKRPISSDESIENLLYYKDCKHKKETPAPVLRSEPAPPACPCPRMCCSMCCDCDQNSNSPQSLMSRQMSPLQQSALEPKQMALPTQMIRHPPPIQPQVIQRGGKKKMNLMKPDMLMQPPIGSRRDLGFTRENIKSLISQDQDIKKILKDLVRVTMRKVDLVDKGKPKRNMPSTPSQTRVSEDDYE